MMISTKTKASVPCFVDVGVEKTKIKIEIVCGAAVSVISLAMYKKYFAHIQASPCTSKLVVVNGQHLKIFGKF